MSALHAFINSAPGQFLIGGLTVAGIGFAGNNVSNKAIAALIAAMPIGMPSSIFIDDKSVEKYAYNLVIMTFVLLAASFTNWALLKYAKMNKYRSVLISLLVFWGLGLLVAFLK